MINKEIEPNQELSIVINQTFHPFKEKEQTLYFGVPAYISKTTLLDSNGFKTPMEIVLIQDGTLDNKSMKSPNVFAPFNPRHGYIITNDDYDPEKRLKKHNEMWRKLDLKPSYFQEKLFCLNIHSLLGDFGLGKELPQQHLRTLKKIRLQVNANRLSFQTRLDINDFYFHRDGHFYISGNFYPLDGGPMPRVGFLPEANRFPTDMCEGVFLNFQNNPKKLSAIEMKFVLDEPRPTKPANK